MVEGSERVSEGRPRPYSAIDEWMAERDQAQPTPADGDDYTYDLRTPTERAAFRVDQAEARLARLEAQVTGLAPIMASLGEIAGRYAEYEQELRTEIRTLAERIQHIEHILEQWTGDHG